MTRSPRALEISAELAAALAATRAAFDIVAEPQVNLDRLQDVEAALGVTFEDDVLALFAASVPALGASLAGVVGTTGDLRGHGLRGDLIGLGTLEPELFLCVKKRRQVAGHSELLEVDAVDGGHRVLTVLELIEERGRNGNAAGEFAPRLYRPAPESTTYGRRVRHKVFGEGSLLSENGTGPNRRCKVDFPGKGLKLLQARFLEFVDE